MKPDEEVKQQIKLLNSDSKSERNEGAKALAKFDCSESIEALVKALEDEDCEVRDYVVQSLMKLNWIPNNNFERTLFLIGKRDWENLSILENPEIEALLFALKDSHVYARRCAALCLSKIDEPALIKPLIEALNESDTFVQNHIFNGLENSTNPISIQAIKGCLSHRIKEVREKAVEILLLKNWSHTNLDEELSMMFARKDFIKMVNLGKEGVEKLYLALKDENEEIVWLAIEALNNITNPESIIYILQKIKEDRSNRENLIKIFLKPMKQILVQEPFIDSLLDEERDIRTVIVLFLERIGWKPETEQEKVFYYIAKENWSKTQDFGDKAIYFLLKALEIDSNEIKIRIIQTFGAIGSKESITKLIDLLTDENSEITHEASIALNKIGWKPETRTREINYAIASRKWSLLKNKGEEIIEPFSRILRGTGNYQQKKEVLRILTEIDSPKATHFLQLATRDTDSWIRKLSKQILEEKDIYAEMSEVDSDDFKTTESDKIGGGEETSEVESSYNEFLTDLTNSDYYMRKKAATRLQELNWEPRNTEEEINMSIALQNWTHISSLGAKSINSLARSLDVDNVLVRRKIVNIIGQYRVEEAKKALLIALQDEDIWVRVIAAKSLKEFNS